MSAYTHILSRAILISHTPTTATTIIKSWWFILYTSIPIHSYDISFAMIPYQLHRGLVLRCIPIHIYLNR